MVNLYIAALADAMCPPEPYGWIIDIDHLSDGPEDEYDGTGTVGPSAITDEQEAKLKAGEGTPFRMYDDDGELYYTGRFLGDSTAEEAFRPLQDYGEGSGCTEIRYKEGNRWVTL